MHFGTFFAPNWRRPTALLRFEKMYCDVLFQHIFRVSVLCKHEHAVAVWEFGKNGVVELVIQIGVVGGCLSQPVVKISTKHARVGRVFFRQ